jgi:ubiquinol-cytochrome c reductase cytochrome b subunit
MHVLRIFFTGAYRKPRELTYIVGVVMLFVALVEGYAGYSLIDDLLSGMGLAIGYAVALSMPLVGANLAQLIWGHPFPGDPAFFSRMYIAHVFLFPMLIATLIGVHLALVAAKHHTQFRRDRRRGERKLVGMPTFPAYAPRSLGLFAGVASMLFLLGGLVQINPIWLWGPYEVGLSTNGAQPDWYLGWLIGALRLVPGFDLTIGGYTVVPNPFWGGALFPLIVLAALLAWPWLERRVTKDDSVHNVLDRPRDAPWRTAIGSAFFTWVVLVFAAGSADRVTVAFGLSYIAQIWVFRVAIWVIPIVVLLVVHRICRELQDADRIDAERERTEAQARAANAFAG